MCKKSALDAWEGPTLHEWEQLPDWLKRVGREALEDAVVAEMDGHADGPKFPEPGYRTCGDGQAAIGEALGINLRPTDASPRLRSRIHSYVQGLMNAWTIRRRYCDDAHGMRAGRLLWKDEAAKEQEEQEEQEQEGLESPAKRRKAAEGVESPAKRQEAAAAADVRWDYSQQRWEPSPPSVDVEELCCARYHLLTGEELVGLLAPSRPKLHSLDLSHCYHIPDAALAKALACCPALGSLVLDNVRALTDDGLAIVAAACGGRLTKLEVRGCMGVTDKGVAAIAAACGGLTHVDLGRDSHTYYCKEGGPGHAGITDESIEALVRGCGASLKALCLRDCWHVSSAGLLLIAHGCPRLEVLDLTDTSVECAGGITDTAICGLARECKALTGIDLFRTSGMHPYRDSTIELLRDELPRLRQGISQ